jgi:hypothetical protein
MTDQQTRHAWNGETWSTWDGSKWVLDSVQDPPPARGAPWLVGPSTQNDWVIRAAAPPKSKAVSAGISAVIVLVIVLVGSIAVIRNINGSDGSSSANGSGKPGANAELMKNATVEQSATFDSKGVAQVQVTMRNTASSDYNFLVYVKATSADGGALYATGQTTFHDMAPGDSEQQEVSLPGLTQANAKSAKFVITNVTKGPATQASF